MPGHSTWSGQGEHDLGRKDAVTEVAVCWQQQQQGLWACTAWLKAG